MVGVTPTSHNSNEFCIRVKILTSLFNSREVNALPENIFFLTINGSADSGNPIKPDPTAACNRTDNLDARAF
ncbi:MAG: hypothetical protein PHP69_07235, partial [Candidatus Omnitrophica bacterium]|nr:hypothetical protein [Candidatus Omnitrophota bacterium]